MTVAERPELWARAYEQVALPTFPDMDTATPLDVSAEDWATEWINDPAAMFLAVVGDDVIGVAGLMLDTDQPERAEVAYTAVGREWRGNAVASTLKRTSMAWAAGARNHRGLHLDPAGQREYATTELAPRLHLCVP